jgi:hypothetical protein
MCRFNGVLLGAGQGGLFEACCGTDDNGTKIDAYFIPYTVDFNDDHPKRLRRIYLGGIIEGNLKLTITGNGSDINGSYTITPNVSEIKQVKMFSIDRSVGHKWVYADIKFENVNGSFFAIDSILAVYSTHHRRRN